MGVEVDKVFFLPSSSSIYISFQVHVSAALSFYESADAGVAVTTASCFSSFVGGKAALLGVLFRSAISLVPRF